MSRPVDLKFETPIFYQAMDSAPRIAARVGGVDTHLIIDSGSTDHVMTMALARQADLTATAAEAGTDHAGREVPSWALGSVTVQISDIALTLERVVAFEAPRILQQSRVGGFLSPQKLWPGGWIVVDLAGHRLSCVDGDRDSVAEWLQERHPQMRLLSALSDESDLVTLHASLVPHAPVTTMLNTGSPISEFAARAVPGLAGALSQEPGYGLSGAAVRGQEVTGQTVEVEGVSFSLPLVLVRPTMPPPVGMLGMDVLAGTVVAIGAERLILWLVPVTR